MMILRSSPPSPFGRKVRIAISVLGFDGAVTIEPADPTNASDSVRQQNPLGKIPVLIAEDGAAYYDSRVILDYLDDRAGGGKIVPRDSAKRGSRRSACRRCATAFSMPRSSPSMRRAGANPRPTSRNGSSTRPARWRGGSRRSKRPRRARARRLPHVGQIALACVLGIAISASAATGAATIRVSSPGSTISRRGCRPTPRPRRRCDAHSESSLAVRRVGRIDPAWRNHRGGDEAIAHRCAVFVAGLPDQQSAGILVPLSWYGPEGATGSLEHR